MSLDSYIDRAEHELRGHRVTLINPTWFLGSGVEVGRAAIWVPGNQMWELVVVSFTYTSSASVGTRALALEYAQNDSPANVQASLLDVSGTFASFPSSATQAASLAVRYTFGAQGGTGTTNATSNKNYLAITRTVLMPGTRVSIQPTNPQAGDAIQVTGSQFLAYDIRKDEIAGADEDPAQRPTFARELAELVAFGETVAMGRR